MAKYEFYKTKLNIYMICINTLNNPIKIIMNWLNSANFSYKF